MLTSAQKVTAFCGTLQHKLSEHKSKNKLYKAVVNAPFTEPAEIISLDLGIIELYLTNSKTNTLDLIAISDTDIAKHAVLMSTKPLKEIKIPIDFTQNILIKAIKTSKPQKTDNWKDLFTPELTPEQATLNQASAGIECSSVYPLKVPNGGVLVFNYFQPSFKVKDMHDFFMQQYTNTVSESFKKLSS